MSDGSDWITGPLGRFIPLQRGFDLPTTKVERGKVPVVYSNGIGRHHSHAMAKGPGVVTGRSGTIGKVHYVDVDYWPHNTALWVTDFKRTDPKFVYYFLQHLGLSRFAGGSGVPTLNRNDAHSFLISMPARRDEQKRISAALTDIDQWIEGLERQVAKRQAIKQGMMQQLLTGRTRLPGFYSAWKETTLGSVSSVTMGQSPAGSTYNSDARGLPLVQGNADIRGRVTFDRIWTSAPTKTCEPGDVLLTVRAPVGYTAIASKRSCLGRGVCAISAGNDNRFMFHALVYAEPAWALYEQGSTFTAVNSNEVRSFAIQWPTDSGERQAIARVLDDADKELASLQARLAKARAIKTGMMQQLLTGRTRVPVEAAS